MLDTISLPFSMKIKQTQTPRDTKDFQESPSYKICIDYIFAWILKNLVTEITNSLFSNFLQFEL